MNARVTQLTGRGDSHRDRAPPSRCAPPRPTPAYTARSGGTHRPYRTAIPAGRADRTNRSGRSSRSRQPDRPVRPDRSDRTPMKPNPGGTPWPSRPWPTRRKPRPVRDAPVLICCIWR
ncbi:hypothetical protein DUI70_1819 [Streptomyces albus]|nr:hypothetical protein DUI70_1819 [Streptomyces albus]